MRNRLWSLDLSSLQWCATKVELPLPVCDCSLAYSESVSGVAEDGSRNY